MKFVGKIKSNIKPKAIKRADKELIYRFEELLIQFEIKAIEFKEILATIINYEGIYHSDALDNEKYSVLKNIVYKLIYMGFNYKQLYEILLFQVSERKISKWVNEKIEGDFKRLPIQFSYRIELSDNEKNIKVKKITELEVNEYIQKLMNLEVSIYSFDGEKNLSLIAIKKLKAESRIKERKR